MKDEGEFFSEDITLLVRSPIFVKKFTASEHFSVHRDSKMIDKHYRRIQIPLQMTFFFLICKGPFFQIQVLPKNKN